MKKLFFAALILVPLTALAHHMGHPHGMYAGGRTEQKPTKTKEIMGGFLYEMNFLKDYSLNEQKFTDQKNHAVIASHLKKLSQLSKEAAHDPVLNQENFRISRKILTGHMAEVERVFNLGNKSYARWMLNSAQGICVSCHTQMPTASRDLKKFEKGDKFSTPFEEAEYLFTTRAFDKASVIYDRIILEFPKFDKEVAHVEIALQRQVAYFSRIKQDPKLAVKTLARYEANKEIPRYVAKEIKPWVTQFEQWNKVAAIDVKSISEAEILKVAAANLPASEPASTSKEGGIKSVVLLKVSGELYEYMKAHPQSKITPDLLYYLSAYDRLLNNNFFFSLANLYLRECIETYPESAVAIKCYQAFEEETILSYTGSGGTRVPAEVREDLKNLKSWVENKGKVQNTAPVKN